MSAEDRTSELPEVILHHILSYLPIKDAASTSVLSKWWNKAWETLPYLNFNDESFMIKTPYTDEWKQVGKHAKLLAAVQRIVQRRQHISIQKFSLLVLPWKDKHLRRLPEEDVEDWNREIGLSSFGVIDYVATPFLRELELVNDIMASWDLLLPPSVVSARCLTSLNLHGFDLSSSWSSSSLYINLPRLQKLILTNVVVDDSILEALIFGSRSSLETLQLQRCFGFSTIHLVGEFVKFKRLSVELTGIVMLQVSDAPEFEDLRVHDGDMFRELLCCYFNIKNCPRLRKIFLDCNFVTQNKLASYENLEELNIEYCSVLNNINISSNSLKTLSLSSMNNLTHLHISSPTLESLTFDLKIIPNLSLNVSTERLRVINLFVTPFDLKWIKFLQYFKRTKIVTIKCCEVVITPAYMSDEPELLSPLHGARNIFFKQQSWDSKIKENQVKTITELVEYLLWLAPRAETVSIASIVSLDETTLLSLELVYDNNEYGNDEQKKIFNCPHCKLLPIDCWRHCLKEIRIQEFNETKYHFEKMKEFFVKEVENLEIVTNEKLWVIE